VRIHFTLDDLARTRLAAAPSPLVATSFSLFRLAYGPCPAQLDLWRRTVMASLPAYPLFGVLVTAGPHHPVPRFLRPHAGLRTLEEELARLAATPKQAIRTDLEYVARHRQLPDWADDLADGDPGVTARITASVRAYHQVAVAPYWRSLTAHFDADRAYRTRQLRDGGIGRLLDSLHPRMHWRPPVLEIDLATGDDFDYHLGGRGLVLAPGTFASYVPCDPHEEQPTLYYQVAGGLAGPAAAGGGHIPLAALLGHSRAAVLEVIADGVSTGQLARRVGLSSASASEHATVLRRAGLVATQRSGRTSRHSLTALGSELLLHAAESGLAAEGS
jgi:DNA-binding transcriptional ArsR family regulator